MENVLRVVREAVDTLEEYFPDLTECAETPAEKRQVESLRKRIIQSIK